VHGAWPTARIARTLWASSFQLGQGQARTYAAGRWFLVGDAAHAMGPSAGAGMMVGLLGAWQFALSMAAGGSPGEIAGRYEQRQRATSRSVQGANKLIFRNLAVRSPVLGGLRNGVFTVLGLVPAVAARFTAREALVGLAPTR
jgi:2-polyprenyl-6-methoxyphenol hydroxylase-like FAD-dependent oxidoreductase